MIPMGRAAKTKQPVHIVDVLADQAYIERYPGMVGVAELGGARTLLIVPMLKENEVVGMIASIARKFDHSPTSRSSLFRILPPRPSSPSRTRGCLTNCENRWSSKPPPLTCSRSSAVRHSIFKSVLDTLVESAARLCEADMAQILRPNDEGFRTVASYGHTPEFRRVCQRIYDYVGRGSVAGRVLMEGKPIQVADVLADPEYSLGEIQQRGAYRTHLGVPLLREGIPIGVLVLTQEDCSTIRRQEH